MELIKLGTNTYYIKNVNNIGVYKINDNDVYIIDTGNDTDCGKKILKLLTENNFNIKGIILTHSHADHIGGNKVIQDRCNCKSYSYGIETSFINNSILESSMLYGSYPLIELQNKFLMAKPSKAIAINNELPNGLEYFSLKGHSLDMIGIKTNDDVYFLADSLASFDTINKYHIFYLYNLDEYLKTLDYLKTLKGKYFVLSHNELKEDIKDLIDLNINKINEIIDVILNICKSPVTYEEILEKVCNHYNLVLNINQYVLIGSTIKAYLTYLKNNNKLNYEFKDNKMLWYFL